MTSGGQLYDVLELVVPMFGTTDMWMVCYLASSDMWRRFPEHRYETLVAWNLWKDWLSDIHREEADDLNIDSQERDHFTMFIEGRDSPLSVGRSRSRSPCGFVFPGWSDSD